MAHVSDDDAAVVTKVVTSGNPDGASNGNDKNNKTIVALGGKRQKQSFALLDGVFQDPDSDEQERVTIAITRLPAVLGRSNESDRGNPHFFGLGKKKALSRKHCTIYYRDREGGHAEWDEKEKTTIYKDPDRMAKDHESSKTSLPKPNPHLVPNDDGSDKDASGLPKSGFFVIECLGKNRILVDRTRVEQGESMVLRSGSAIRISSYMLYFLLPTDAEPKPHKIELPDDRKPAAKKVSKKQPSKTTAAPKGGASAKTASAKKRPAPVPSSSAAAAAVKKPKKSSTNTATATLAELEKLPVEELIEKMDEAVTKGLWDRKNQFIGGVISYHAVRSAGASPEIQEKVATGGGVSRSDIMEWIEQSELYGGWVSQMLTCMEPRSYQAAITKSLLKSGFTRTSGAGRYIKWRIPDDVQAMAKKSAKAKPSKPKAKPKPKEEELEEGGDSGDDKEDANKSDQSSGEADIKEDSNEEEEEEEDGDEEEGSTNETGNEEDNDDGEEDDSEANNDEEEESDDNDGDNELESSRDGGSAVENTEDHEQSEGNQPESDDGERDFGF